MTIWRPERERRGYCKVFFRSGNFAILERAEFEPLSLAIAEQHKTYCGRDLFGDENLIVIGEVEQVMDCEPASVAAADEEEEQRKMANP